MSEPILRAAETGPAGLDACFDPVAQEGRVLRRRIWLGVLAASGLGALIALAPRHAPLDEPEPRVEVQRRPDWVDQLKAAPDFQLAQDGSRETRSHSVQIHEPGGGRRDALAADGPEGALRIVVWRPGAEWRAPASLHVDMVRLAAVNGFAVIASAQAPALATRFGSFESADIRVSGDSGERNCSGFRSMIERDGARLAVTGFACGGGEEAMSPKSLACRINRLEAAPGAPAELKKLLGPAPRKNCDPPRSAAGSASASGG